MAPAGIWKESYRVRAYETDPSGRASTESMCNYLQEAAANHAGALGVSFDQLRQQNSTWVLSRLRVRVERYPGWQDDIVVETWPSGIERLFATRDFFIKDADGDLLARAVSWWLLIDVERRRPLRLPEFVTSLDLPDRERALNGSPAGVPEPGADALSREIRVRYGDLDINGHANNVRFVEWSMEAVPPEILQSMRIGELDVHFKSEAVYGDAVTVSVESVSGDNTAFAHAVRSSDDGRELARLKTMWRDW